MPHGFKLKDVWPTMLIGRARAKINHRAKNLAVMTLSVYHQNLYLGFPIFGLVESWPDRTTNGPSNEPITKL